MKLSTKVVKIDFKAIIDNALNRDFWERKWLIFDYGGYTIDLTIHEIGVYNNRILMKLRTINKDTNSSDVEYFSLPMDQFNLEVFKKSVLRGAHDSINTHERALARETEEYQLLQEKEKEENARRVAELNDYLDDSGVTQRDIREAYIDGNYTPSRYAFNYTLTFDNNRLSHIHNQIDLMIEFKDE